MTGLLYQAAMLCTGLSLGWSLVVPFRLAPWLER